MAKVAEARHAYAAEDKRTQARTDTDRQTAQTEVTPPRTRGGQEANQHPDKTDPKLAQRAQDSTETAQGGPKTAQDGFCLSRRCPKTAQDGRRQSQDGPKQPQDGPRPEKKQNPLQFLMVFGPRKSPQEAPKWPNTAVFQHKKPLFEMFEN